MSEAGARSKVAISTRCGFALLIIVFSASCARQLGPKDGLELPPHDWNRVTIGREAPDFTLEDMAGRPVTLSSFRGTKFVILIFYRGYW
jgi:cytochrome oxidase Cu insertion factor (SCO1/SenC/PrrC family)